MMYLRETGVGLAVKVPPYSDLPPLVRRVSAAREVRSRVGEVEVRNMRRLAMRLRLRFGTGCDPNSRLVLEAVDSLEDSYPGDLVEGRYPRGTTCSMLDISRSSPLLAVVAAVIVRAHSADIVYWTALRNHVAGLHPRPLGQETLFLSNRMSARTGLSGIGSLESAVVVDMPGLALPGLLLDKQLHLVPVEIHRAGQLTVRSYSEPVYPSQYRCFQPYFHRQHHETVGPVSVASILPCCVAF